MIALVRTEFTKATRRLRTLIIFAVLVGLPTLIVVAIHARGNRPERGDNGEGLFRLAQQSGLLVPAAVLNVMSGFFLIVVAGMFAGDAIAGDASWGNLRYLLMRPVTRGRLLIAKAFVAGVMIWVCTILVAVAALIGGVILFGSHAVTIPNFAGLAQGDLSNLGFTLSQGTLLLRLLYATAYVAFGFTGLLAMGVFFSTLTDMAVGAIIATIGIYIISEIMDAISQLGTIRYLFPTHYQASWTTMFTQNQFSHDLLAGVIVQLAYLVVFGAAALIWFRRKDIRS